TPTRTEKPSDSSSSPQRRKRRPANPTVRRTGTAPTQPTTYTNRPPPDATPDPAPAPQPRRQSPPCQSAPSRPSSDAPSVQQHAYQPDLENPSAPLSPTNHPSPAVTSSAGGYPHTMFHNQRFTARKLGNGQKG